MLHLKTENTKQTITPTTKSYTTTQEHPSTPQIISNPLHRSNIH
jgi:hypothetical protein